MTILLFIRIISATLYRPDKSRHRDRPSFHTKTHSQLKHHLVLITVRNQVPMRPENMHIFLCSYDKTIRLYCYLLL